MSIQKSESDKGFRGYIFSRSINNNFIPQRVQNLVIKDFASRKKLFFKLSSTEYIMENCFHMLKALVKEIKLLNGIIFYSIEMLPKKKNLRDSYIKKILKEKKTIYFALEEIKISSLKEYKKLDTILKIKFASKEYNLKND
tara:strand:+ start:442 stop:864 length:423 start_codon:yes stop_codon:yes gene_type:complete